MAFDKSTRNSLQRLVSDARSLLTDEFTRQLQQDYGLDPKTGGVTDLSKLSHLDDNRLETARVLREILTHYLASEMATSGRKSNKDVLDRIVREQAFTVLNRLAALRMMEARGLLLESIANGYQSKGFQLYDRLAGHALGETGDAYRCYLFSLFDEFALDLNVLFDRYATQGLLFAREPTLLALLELLNTADMEPLWAEDETIGWIYQYWNSKEERKAMRDASAAPRNSRELAVRNQFFTPRYVVEFLTDNTLGRIWYEMTKGETCLSDECRYLVRRPTEIFLGEGEEAPEASKAETEETLSQEELLKQPVHIPHRAIKDPREIRLLDPACGSMHFGLYAFDLFEVIYQEAWGLESSIELKRKDSSLKPIRETYSSKDEFLKDVPRLIIEHNIHGVDIDPRAVQIAGLSLWLRAQKTWRDTPAAERPHVRRSNIVCAEPMPGSDAMLEDFVSTLDPPLLGELVKTVFDKMQLAGEAGTLLKIEEEIRTAIDDARQAWEKLQRQSPELFSTDELNRVTDQPELSNLDTALSAPGSRLTGDFFDTAEERIYAALRDYAESAEAGDYQRRLFAEDAAHGFAFIDLCRKRYDGVVMNPPFGAEPKCLGRLSRSQYPLGRSDLYACFVERAVELGVPALARIGVLSSRTGFFLTSLTNWRIEYLLGSSRLDCAADLGLGVLDDALVEAAAYVITNATNSEVKVISCLAADNKESVLLSKIQASDMFRRKLNTFSELPLSPIAYWVNEHVADLYSHFPELESNYGCARVGLQTSDDYRFLRNSWEVAPTRIGQAQDWVPMAKGGDYHLFYHDLNLLVNWQNGGHEMKGHAELHAEKSGSARGNSALRDFDFYFQRGLTYPARTTSEFSPRVLPKGCITGTKGPGIHTTNDEDAYYLLAWLTTRYVRELLEASIGLGDAVASGSAARDYQVRTIGRLPVPSLDENAKGQVVERCRTAVSSSMHDFAFDETSRIFQSPSVSKADALGKMLRRDLSTQENHILDTLESHFEYEQLLAKVFPDAQIVLSEVARNIGIHPCSLGTELARAESSIATAYTGQLEAMIDLVSADLGFSRQITKKAYFADRRIELLALWAHAHPREIIKVRRASELVPLDSEAEFCQSQLSFLLGCSVGRWDIRYATGERQPPELPDPFDPLPVCPPGMLQNAVGLPAAKEEVPGDYPLRITWPGILVDDDGHTEDIVARVRDALAVIWGDRSAAIEQEACEILGVRTLRDYFAETKSGGKFFKDHLKRYSKSRRKAPIYWPLSTKSGSYTLWIYYHRINDQILYVCVNDFVEPKLRQVSDNFESLRKKSDRTSKQEKELTMYSDLKTELEEYRDELLRIAKFWKPNLNDGVQMTAAPLWPLFCHKPWQKVLRSAWEKLEKGDFDWAHLAMSYWPDRVREKCKTDKSLAIAHALEDVYEEKLG